MVKSFQEFLNEFEVEGEQVPSNKYRYYYVNYYHDSSMEEFSHGLNVVSLYNEDYILKRFTRNTTNVEVVEVSYEDALENERDGGQWYIEEKSSSTGKTEFFSIESNQEIK